MQTMNYAKQQGFTLVELMIVVVIIAILMSIAIPSYQRHVLRANRSAAQVEMMDIANRQQQFLLSNRAYVDQATLQASGYSPPAAVTANYNYAIVLAPAGAPPTFLVTFTPVPGTQQAADPALTLDNTGLKGPAGYWEH